MDISEAVYKSELASMEGDSWGKDTRKRADQEILKGLACSPLAAICLSNAYVSLGRSSDPYDLVLSTGSALVLNAAVFHHLALGSLFGEVCQAKKGQEFPKEKVDGLRWREKVGRGLHNLACEVTVSAVWFACGFDHFVARPAINYIRSGNSQEQAKYSAVRDYLAERLGFSP